ncbi:MAG TPA: cytochrome c oxidase subunit 3 [Geminicoccaceae bacterium]|nr:cytochrome c oxidase subunit 3 [Geminicoccaceae bacterium]
MTIFRQLVEKPWEPAQGAVVLHGGRSFQLPAEAVALRVFLAVVTVLFSLLVAAYAMRMTFEDWRPVPDPRLLWLNTALLISSSAAFHWAWTGIRGGRLDRARLGMLVAGGFAVAFLMGQLWAWQQLNAMRAFDITNPAIAFFYLITALHGLHLLGGLVAWSMTMSVVWRGTETVRAVRQVKLCATYWHFLLVLWLVLFGLLFSGNENLDLLLSICGLR